MLPCWTFSDWGQSPQVQKKKDEKEISEINFSILIQSNLSRNVMNIKIINEIF